MGTIFLSFNFRYSKFSRRQWDGLIKAWKLQIHAWNASSKESEETFPVVDEWTAPIKEEIKEEPEKKPKRSFSFKWSDEPEDKD